MPGKYTTSSIVAEGQDHLGHYIVRAGCSNQLQVGQGQVLIRVVSLCKCLVDAANVTESDGQ